MVLLAAPVDIVVPTFAASLDLRPVSVSRSLLAHERSSVWWFAHRRANQLFWVTLPPPPHGQDPGGRGTMRPRVLLVTDPGPDPDDVKAILIAAMEHLAGRMRLLGVVANGGGDSGRRARFAKRLLDLVGLRRVAVGAGSNGKPQVPRPHEYALEGAEDTVVGNGAQVMASAVKHAKAKSITFVCISSLRDLADLILVHRARVLRATAAIVIQGGLVEDPHSPGGFAPDDSVNNTFDMDAARLVYAFALEEGIRLTVVSRLAVPLVPMQLATSFAMASNCPIMKYLDDAQRLGLKGLWVRVCAGELPGRCSKAWFFQSFCGLDEPSARRLGLFDFGADDDITSYLNGYVKPYDVVALMTALERFPFPPPDAQGRRLLLTAGDTIATQHVVRLLRDTYNAVINATSHERCPRAARWLRYPPLRPPSRCAVAGRLGLDIERKLAPARPSLFEGARADPSEQTCVHVPEGEEALAKRLDGIILRATSAHLAASRSAVAGAVLLLVGGAALGLAPMLLAGALVLSVGVHPVRGLGSRRLEQSALGTAAAAFATFVLRSAGQTITGDAEAVTLSVASVAALSLAGAALAAPRVVVSIVPWLSALLGAVILATLHAVHGGSLAVAIPVMVLALACLPWHGHVHALATSLLLRDDACAALARMMGVGTRGELAAGALARYAVTCVGPGADFAVVAAGTDASAAGAKLAARKQDFFEANGRAPVIWSVPLHGCAEPSVQPACLLLCRRLLVLAGPGLLRDETCTALLFAWQALGGSMQAVYVDLIGSGAQRVADFDTFTTAGGRAARGAALQEAVRSYTTLVRLYERRARHSSASASTHSPVASSRP